MVLKELSDLDINASHALMIIRTSSQVLTTLNLKI